MRLVEKLKRLVYKNERKGKALKELELNRQS
jgi:hypothetical protein